MKNLGRELSGAIAVLTLSFKGTKKNVVPVIAQISGKTRKRSNAEERDHA